MMGLGTGSSQPLSGLYPAPGDGAGAALGGGAARAAAVGITIPVRMEQRPERRRDSAMTRCPSCRIQGAGVLPCLEPESPCAHPPPDVTNATMGPGSE